MNIRATKACRLALLAGLLLWFCPRVTQAAERELHWEALDVAAHLDAGGILDVIERHAMVFSGDWNGGERVFNVRRRQKLELLGVQRLDAATGTLKDLQETPVPNSVDEFSWVDGRTLRWRSRLPSDPPFADTHLIYVLHYRLSGILLKEDGQYRIDHDFAFPDRSGSIERFTLNLALDPVWQPLRAYQNRYSAGPLAPGKSFVLDIPLRYSGSTEPSAIDNRRPAPIVAAVLAIPAIFLLLALAFLLREQSLGRLAAVDPAGIDCAWIENNILSDAAEVVGAAWDGRIAASEVVALIARMTSEGTLESKVDGPGSMRLSLRVDRNKLHGHERALVDALFFENRDQTSTAEVRRHYKKSGFDPASVIKPPLEILVKTILPPGETRVRHRLDMVLYLAGLVLLGLSAYSMPDLGKACVVLSIISLPLIGLLQIPGFLFRSRIDWGVKAAALLLLPAFAVSLGVAAFLWWYAGIGEVELPWTMIAALTIWAGVISNLSIKGMKSRQSRAAIAFRKKLARGRSFFMHELERPKPSLRDEWYPWLLAFGLGKQVDVWSSRHHSASRSSLTVDHSTSRGSSSAPSADTAWSGGGGLSGGGGATGTWAAAAAGMAAGVSAPSSSSGSGSSSSSGGSSGGGGGGGW